MKILKGLTEGLHRFTSRKSKRRSRAGMNAKTDQDQHWRTPPWLKAEIEKLAGGPIDLDPCASADGNNPLAVPHFYTEITDGLSKPWALEGVRVVYVNPPYKQAARWVEKIQTELERAPHLAIYLLGPAFTDQPWYHAALSFAIGEWSVKGRVRFLRVNGKPAVGPRFPSSIFEFGSCYGDATMGQTIRRGTIEKPLDGRRRSA